ncbi:MAG: CoA transferase [Candidatus Obscuribacter sp.]|nr:CoA transferase [Candidatus Obscuribacter sp.]MBK9276784.1 CoA transferase [Candidatus Obscuribacter sp.]
MTSLETKERSLGRGELKVLADLSKLLGIDKHFQGEVTLQGHDPILKSPHHLSEATAYALLAEAMAAVSIANLGGAKANSLSINVTDAIHFLHSSHFLWQSGYGMTVGAEYIPTNGIFACRDGKHIMIEAGPPYIKLERGYLNFFDCGNNRESIAREIAKYDGEELQEALSQKGLPACLAYTKEEWRAHPQGQELLKVPVIEIEKLADGKPVPFKKNEGLGPLHDIKVLDFTHVLAGPRSARTLANYGAQVLHISSPFHMDTLPQNLLVNPGKHSAYLELNTGDNLTAMKELARQADVFTTSYRPAVNARFGLTPQELVKLNENIICLTINAYGHSGPWQDRPGFDQNAQVATGFAAKEGERLDGPQTPQFSPVFYLNDFLTAYLAAAGVLSALIKRATEGGSYHVKVSLARSAMWVQDMGYIEKSAYGAQREKDTYPANLVDVQSPFGTITELAPAVQFEHSPLVDILPVRPFGADKPVFWR